jgi:GNAT superfamily N-acetyltransferase
MRFTPCRSHDQAGLAFVDLREPQIARWSAKDFFVPPGLWGSGIGEKFLNKLLKELRAPRCEVTVERQKRTDLASRQERNDLIAFYKRAGFRLENGQLVWTQR